MIELYWLGTAGFRVRAGAHDFLIDPHLSRHVDARPRQSLGVADLRGVGPVFLSHGHFDHATDAPALVAGTPHAIYGSATALAPALRAGVSLSQLRPARPGQVFEFTSFRAQAFASRHTRFDLALVVRTARRAGWDGLTALNLGLRYPAGQVLSWRFDVGGISLHHFGSAGDRVGQLRRSAAQSLDALLLPLQGHSRIVEIVLRHVEALRPRVVILHHWDDFFPPLSQMVDARPFVEEARRRFPDVRIIRPTLNQPIYL